MVKPSAIKLGEKERSYVKKSRPHMNLDKTTVPRKQWHCLKVYVNIKTNEK